MQVLCYSLLCSWGRILKHYIIVIDRVEIITKGGIKLKIIFMGTPDFARDSLDAIYHAGHEIAAVITVPDKPKRKRNEINSL